MASWRYGEGVRIFIDRGAPYGNRTRVSAVKGRRPGPLDEGRVEGSGAATYTCLAMSGQAIGPGESGQANAWRTGAVHHFPVFGIDFHGSAAGSAVPFLRSSIDCLSGERTKAITPSRGGRLMVMPPFIRRSQVS